MFCFDDAIKEKMQDEKRGKATLTSEAEGQDIVWHSAIAAATLISYQ